MPHGLMYPRASYVYRQDSSPPAAAAAAGAEPEPASGSGWLEHELGKSRVLLFVQLLALGILMYRHSPSPLPTAMTERMFISS
jgi:hypothetical protein